MITIIEKYKDFYETRIDGLTFRGSEAQQLVDCLLYAIQGIKDDEIIIDYHATKTEYYQLLSSGMLFEFYPQSTGDWGEDRHLFIK